MVNTGKNLLAMVKPPKPVSQMSEQELDEFVQMLSDLVGRRLADEPLGAR